MKSRRIARMRSVRLWLRALFRHQQLENEMAEEFQFHLERQIEALVDRGLSPDEARQKALQMVGSIEPQKERCRDAWGTQSVENCVRDLRYALRVLVKNRGFSIVVILSLALGIGANTAIFSLVDALVLQPLPYRDAARLMALSETNRSSEDLWTSWPDFLDWRKQSRSFSSIAAIEGGIMTLTGSGQAVRLVDRAVSSSFLKILGVQPLLGRDFSAEDDRPGAAATAILSYDLWQRQFGGDRYVLGRALNLDGRTATVIGVLPASFRFRYGGDIYLPIGLEEHSQGARTDRYGALAIAKLKESVSIAQARSEMDTIARRLQAAYPASNSGINILVRPLSELVAGSLRRTALAIWIAAGLLLLLVCVNSVNLQLAKAAANQRELSVRAALGASRKRLLMQKLLESGVLVVCGTITGCALAYVSLPVLTGLLPFDIRRYIQPGIHLRAMEFTVLAALITTVFTGFFSGMNISLDASWELLKSGTHTAGGGFRRLSLRSTLIAGEIALAAILLVGAGLLMKSLEKLESINPGFQTNRLLTVRLTLPTGHYPTAKSQVDIFNRLVESVNAIPGVVSASGTACMPLAGKGCGTSTFQIEGQPLTQRQDLPSAQSNAIGVGYLKTMDIPLLQGRRFTLRDDLQREPVILINQRFANKYFAHEDPIGKRIWVGTAESHPPLATIVGIIGNVRREQLDEPAPPEITEAIRQRGGTFQQLVVRMRSENTSEIAAAIRKAVAEIDANIPVFDVRTMDWYLDNQTTNRRLPAVLTTIFGTAALLLAAIGLYGLLAFLITQRTQEMGIRMAVGARPVDLLRMVTWEGLRLTLIGLAFGIFAALAMSHGIAGLLFGTSATDPWTFVGVSILLITVAVIACAVPARRTTKLDAMQALRME